MLNIPFKSVSGDGYLLNSNFRATGMTASDDSGTSDQLQYWDAATSGYETFWYFEGDPSDSDYPAGWYSFESGEKFETDYPEGFTPGTPFWYLSIGSAGLSATDSGGVPSEASYTFPIVKGNFNMIATPYPSALLLNNNITILNGVASDDSGTSDQMQFWNPKTSGYETFWYFEGDPSDASYPAGWYSFDSGEKFETDYPAGFSSTKPFWYLALGSDTGSITFTKPF